jgi:nucleotidyltransferase/DNA polymerase involved in DNA repair
VLKFVSKGFFASRIFLCTVERRDPELVRKPVGVGGEATTQREVVVSTASYGARKFETKEEE